jgi:hypothetical protein
MQFDTYDVQITNTVSGREFTMHFQHIPTGIAVERKIALDATDPYGYDTFENALTMMYGLLREEINTAIPGGQPDKLVRLTEAGRSRILSAKAGWIYVVHRTTPNATFKPTVHVKDSAGNTWTLGPDDYEEVIQA